MADTSSLAGVNVLVVEDDPATRKFTALLLTECGALVTSVASAEEALRAVAKRRPDLIVIDLVLPRMGGLALVEQLKGDPATSSIALIAVSSLNGVALERTVLAAGCAVYLRKPIDIETFAATIATHMGK